MGETKIAIMTYYYNSCNYGGCLQAYALCKYLNLQGTDAKQLSYDFDRRPPQKKVNRTLVGKIRHRMQSGIEKNIAMELGRVRTHLEKRYNKNHFAEIEKIKNARKKVFDEFRNNEIPHTENIFDYANISDCVNDYDVFITGSDQVWNVDWCARDFFLGFVPSAKTKISYAASIAKTSLAEDEKSIFEKSLKDYDAVSVREENSVDMIKDLSPVIPQFVVDPVLLLGREEWDVLGSDRKYDEPYVLCYFLGENKRAMKLANKFAQKNKMKTVVIPMITNRFSISDKSLWDEFAVDASPGDFISLIKNAEYIFTDSFHACVFSSIYNKDFFAFNRDRKGTMNSRIVSLLDMFGIPERFCNTKSKEKLSYLENLPSADYTKAMERFRPMQDKSQRFLIDNIGLNGCDKRSIQCQERIL